MERRCYTCKQYGHYKDRCPQKHKNVKCYFCDGLGHYQEKCPLKKEQIENERKQVEKRRLEQEEKNDEKWFHENLPDCFGRRQDLPRTIANIDEIISFLKNLLEWECFNIHTEDEGTHKCLFDGKGKIFGCESPPLRRKVDGMSIEIFIDFLSQKGTIAKISNFIETDVEKMVGTLRKAKIVKVVRAPTSKTRNDYFIGSRKVMRLTDIRGRETTILEPDIIKCEYEKFVSQHNAHVNIVRLELTSCFP